MDFDFGRGTDPFASRANTVFARMNALGLEYMGPQHPNGRRADPTPDHLPEDTENVCRLAQMPSGFRTAPGVPP